MRLVKSLLERCFDLITLLSENAGGMPLGEISRRLDLPKSAAHRLLTSLISLGWAEQEFETGFYRLSLRLAVVGQRLLVGTGIPDICQPILDRLAAATEGLGRIAIVDHEGLTWIAQSQGARTGTYLPAGPYCPGAPSYNRKWEGLAGDTGPKQGFGARSCKWSRTVRNRRPAGYYDQGDLLGGTR